MRGIPEGRGGEGGTGIPHKLLLGFCLLKSFYLSGCLMTAALL